MADATTKQVDEYFTVLVESSYKCLGASAKILQNVINEFNQHYD